MPTKPKLPSDDEIRGLAHKYWEDEGRPEGQSETHWHRAYEALTKPAKKPAAATPTKTSKKK